MKKKFKKGIDVEFMGNPIEEWIRDKLGSFENEHGELKCDIEIEIKKFVKYGQGEGQ